MKLRDYQSRAVNDVMLAWKAGHMSVCLVAPTGSGKTVMAQAIVDRALSANADVVAVAHRRELIEQMCSKFPQSAPICTGMAQDPTAAVQVGTIQTLLAGGHRPEARLVIIDECHHYPDRSKWNEFLDAYKNARILGLTATPERADGQPLGDVFSHMVVAANYSELLNDGYISPCDVYSIGESLGSHRLAQSPVAAYNKYTPNTQALCFVGSVDGAKIVCEEFIKSGVNAAVIDGTTKQKDRGRALALFRGEILKVLVNVYTLTEGVDLPVAETAIIARNVGHASTYLQMVGRVLRTSKNKTRATLLDLSGVHKLHGLPTIDRNYSLNGTAIGQPSDIPALRVCLRCGYTHDTAPKCPRCAFVYPVDTVARPTIYDRELKKVYDGGQTPPDAKEKEFLRLRMFATDRGFDLYWVTREYEKLFNERVPADWFEIEARQKFFEKLLGMQRARGYKDGFARARYKASLGVWPSRSWG